MSNPSVTPASSWAEVRVRDRVMRYRRSGAGRPVLLLQASEEQGALWPDLRGVLAGDHRVLVPENPPGGVDLAAWLADLLEGLGVRDVALVVAGSLCIPALEYVLLDADLISALVLVPAGHAPETALAGFLGSLARPEALPLLVLRREHPYQEALDRLCRFLRPGPA